MPIVAGPALAVLEGALIAKMMGLQVTKRVAKVVAVMVVVLAALRQRAIGTAVAVVVAKA
jgi:hypothetical protein